MGSSSTASPISCSAAPLDAVDADLLIVPWSEGQSSDAVSGLDAATGGEITRALASGEFSARPYDLFVTPITAGGWRAGVWRSSNRSAGFGSDIARGAAFAGPRGAPASCGRVAVALRRRGQPGQSGRGARATAEG